MFEYKNTYCSRNNEEISAVCHMDAELPYFKGHFPSTPILPAAAQLIMVNELMQIVFKRAMSISAENVKFIRQIIPGDIIEIKLTNKNSSTFNFKLHNIEGSLVSKGLLKFTWR